MYTRILAFTNVSDLRDLEIVFDLMLQICVPDKNNCPYQWEKETDTQKMSRNIAKLSWKVSKGTDWAPKCASQDCGSSRFNGLDPWQLDPVITSRRRLYFPPPNSLCRRNSILKMLHWIGKCKSTISGVGRLVARELVNNYLNSMWCRLFYFKKRVGLST